MFFLQSCLAPVARKDLTLVLNKTCPAKARRLLMWTGMITALTCGNAIAECGHSLRMTGTQVKSSATTAGVEEQIERLFTSNHIVDGALELTYRPSGASNASEQIPVNTLPDFDRRDLRTIIQDTGVTTASIPAGASPQALSAAINRLRSNDTGCAVLTHNDLTKAYRSGQLALLFYLQSPWPLLNADGERLSECTGHADNLRFGNPTIAASINQWVASGLRIFQPGFSRTDNAGRLRGVFYAGTFEQDPVGLTCLGRKVIGALMDSHVLIDVSHLGMTATLETAQMAVERGVPILANHANSDQAQPLSPAHRHRNKSDQEICAIARTGGVVGLMPLDRYVKSGAEVSIHDYIAHIDHIRNLSCTDRKGAPIDMVNHIGLASNTSVNGAGQTDRIAGLEDIDRWKNLAAELMSPRYNYSREFLERLFGGNFMAAYRAVLPGLGTPHLQIPEPGADYHRNFATNRVSDFVFDWQTAEARGVQKPLYTVTIQKRNGSRFVHHDREGPVRETNLTYTDPIESGVYRWRVAAKNTSGQKVETAWRIFRIN